MTWNTLPTWSNGDVPDAADLNKYLQNLEHLHAPVLASYAEPEASADLTTTSTTWADVGANWNFNITTEGGLVLVLVALRLTNLSIDLEIDGTRLGEAGTTGVGSSQTPTGTTHSTQVLLPHLLVLSAGAHTIKLKWRTPSGTGTITANTSHARMYVMKLRGG